jgi:hypothetical protein
VARVGNLSTWEAKQGDQEFQDNSSYISRFYFTKEKKERREGGKEKEKTEKEGWRKRMREEGRERERERRKEGSKQRKEGRKIQ